MNKINVKKEMCYSSHADFFSEDLPTSKKAYARPRETRLKGEILHRAIANDLYKRKLL